MKEALLTVLRDKTTPALAFRKTAEQLAAILAVEMSRCLPTESYNVQTPVCEFTGQRITNEIALVPVLRSGLAILPTFLHFFPNAKVGFIGVKRDERTAESHLYYDNLPKLNKEDQVLILDPMLATGGTAILTIRLLQHHGVPHENIYVLGIICSTPGRMAVQEAFPAVHIRYLTEDPILNDAKYIIPGLGDFGDRYFKS